MISPRGMLAKKWVLLSLLLQCALAAKLIIRVCDGPSCTSSRPALALATTIDTAAGGAIDVGFTRCLGWCKKGPNVKVIPEGAVDGVAIKGMDEVELTAKCFHGVSTDEAAVKLATSVAAFIEKK